MAVTDGQYVGGSDIDDMAGFVVGFRNGVDGVQRPVGGSNNMDILLGGSYCIVAAAAVYELVALGFLMDRKI